MALRLASLGERNAIAQIRRLYNYEWPDDDCFYFPTGKRYTLVTTDAAYGKSHIPKGVAPERVGHFIAAVTLSDIAAMGGMPRYFMASILLPRSTNLSYLKGIERGIRGCISKYGARMAGGDLKEGPLTVAGVCIGDVEKGGILRRRGMKVGDLVCVTNSLGKNAAGYYMWKKTGARKWAELLLDVEPRIREGRFLSGAGASSAIDLSDGVYSAISQLRKINGKGFEIDYDKLPVHRHAAEASRKARINIEELALNFGGDYELLFTVSKRRYHEMLKRIKGKKFSITAIGRVVRGENRLVKNGRKIRIRKRGYEHFLRGQSG